MMNTQSTFTARLTAILCVIGCFLTLSGGLISLAEVEPTPDEGSFVSEPAEESLETTADQDVAISEDPVESTDPSESEDPSETTDPSVTDEPFETTAPIDPTDPMETTTAPPPLDTTVETTTTPPVITTIPRPSTRPVTKTGAVQSMPQSPLSTDPISGQVTQQTVPGDTSVSNPETLEDQPATPSDTPSVTTDSSAGNASQEEGANPSITSAMIVASEIFAIAAIVSIVAVILTKFMKLTPKE